MTWNMKLGGICGGVALATLLAVLVASPPPAPAQSDQPIRIGLSMALTGPLAPNGKQALLGAKIWEEEINAKRGLLGRKVELVNYDDQSNPATVPGIYTKLLDVTKSTSSSAVTRPTWSHRRCPSSYRRTRPSSASRRST